jgi:uncharacterized protein YoxC
MEGLSSAASVIAVIQLTGIIVNILVNICGGYVQEVKEARDDIITLQRTVAGLEEILQKLKGLLQDSNVDSTKLPSSSSLVSDITDCLLDLGTLKRRLILGRGRTG